MKILNTFFVLAIFCCSWSQGQTKNSKEVRLLNTLNFIIEQQNTLEYIKTNFPEISTEAIIANQEFNKSYSRALNNIYIDAKKIIEVDLEIYVANIVNRHNDQLHKKELSEKEAGSFINKVKRRARGSIASKYLEIIKKYEDNNTNLMTFKN